MTQSGQVSGTLVRVESPVGRGPLAVDLDGTLVRTDLLHEAIVSLARVRPWTLIMLAFWSTKSKAIAKQRLAELVPIDAGALPYHIELIEWLRGQRDAGRTIILATGSNHVYAKAVADHIGLFDAILASDGQTDLAGRARSDLLVQLYGERCVSYAANAKSALQVWPHCASAVLVNATAHLSRRAAESTAIERVFVSNTGAPAAVWARGLRVQQWLKNLLVFVPLAMSHRIAELDLVVAACLAFLAFSLVASGTYILNDLFDLGADRRHPRKHLRPFAAGQLQIRHGVLAMVLAIAAGLAISTILSWLFISTIAIYLFTTVCYSLRWKRIPVLDVFVLAALYTLRILAGAAAVMVVPSFWLLAFSMFVFLSLAILKRFVELNAAGRKSVDASLDGRGYVVGDEAVLSAMGVSAGVVAALVLALYVDSPGTHDLYSKPWMIWLVCPVFLYWISRIWLKAHRGDMHDDPVVFALTDKPSLLIGALTATVFYLAI